MKHILFLLAAALSSPALAEVRLELGVGMAIHTLAPEGSWNYNGYRRDMKLMTHSYSVGVGWTIWEIGAWHYGVRAGYANLGVVQSWNTFPIFEDGSQRDNRVNPNCNRQTLEGCIGAYNGQGHASGYYFGPMVERNFGGGVFIGGEFGGYKYKSAWTADNVRAVDSQVEPFATFGGDWDYARGYHVTSYLGAHARWQWVKLEVRRYSNVRASRVDVHPDFVGMTSGAVWVFQVGATIPLR